ncbi:MAG: Eco57I restriction-modification methylase domain-containing protein [Saprospiraceae bacterium]
MRTSAFQNNTQLSIGAVFTPLDWAEFAIREFGIYEAWMSGKTVFDPTMGEGNLLEALVKIALNRGFKVSEIPVERLFGVELNTDFFERFFVKMKASYGVEMPRKNFENADIFFLEREQKFDLILGNPPWMNFTDLPEGYKNQLKPKFFEHDLIGNAKDLLLGGSRIDVAALVVQKAIAQNLRAGGTAVFFLPLSLLLNDGANKHFRTYRINGTRYRIETVFDFNDAGVFEGIATRYGLVKFVRDEEQHFPIPFKRWEHGAWADYMAKPAFLPTDPLSILDGSEADFWGDFEAIVLPKHSTPRQGVNTCGANDCFFFDHYESLDEHLCQVSNSEVKAVLPKQFVLPLLTGKNFRGENIAPQKWVLLPYRLDGRPLEPRQVLEDEFLSKYLFEKEQILKNRKGTMLAAWINKGYWWAMLGVGDYNFAPYKIVWEAYGKTDFEPRIFEGNWQVNQSLQAYIPLKTKQEAEEILKKLQDKRIENYLRSLKMEGTMNWAQPGKIKKLVRFEEEALTLF